MWSQVTACFTQTLKVLFITRFRKIFKRLDRWQVILKPYKLVEVILDGTEGMGQCVIILRRSLFPRWYRVQKGCSCLELGLEMSGNIGKFSCRCSSEVQLGFFHVMSKILIYQLHVIPTPDFEIVQTYLNLKSSSIVWVSISWCRRDDWMLVNRKKWGFSFW